MKAFETVWALTSGITFGATGFSVLKDCPTKGNISTDSVRDFFFHPRFAKNRVALSKLPQGVVGFLQI